MGNKYTASPDGIEYQKINKLLGPPLNIISLIKMYKTKQQLLAKFTDTLLQELN